MKSAILLTILYGVLGVPIEDEAFQEFVNGNHKFSADIYKEILKEQKGNFVASPLSAEIILALTNEGARGETATELATGLSLPSSKEKTRKALTSFLPYFKKYDNSLKLLSANRIYTGQGVVLEEDFKSIATTVYQSGAENVDFSKKEEAANTINNWVDEKTNHKITKFLKKDDVKDDTKLILVNALYFGGKWTSPFSHYATDNKKFFKTKEDSVDVATMSQTEHFSYYENPTLNAKFLELPYIGGQANVKMVIVLPTEKDGLKSLEQNIEQVLAPQPYTYERVDVELPKFTTETEIRFIPILKKLGIRKLFGPADLTGLSANVKDLYVSDVIQKAFINVTESGTEAAAATAVIAGERSAHVYRFDPVVFHADHPFLYLIESNGVILFIGRYTVIAGVRSAHVYRFDPVVFHADHPFLYLIESNGVILFIGRYAGP